MPKEKDKKILVRLRHNPEYGHSIRRGKNGSRIELSVFKWIAISQEDLRILRNPHHEQHEKHLIIKEDES